MSREEFAAYIRAARNAAGLTLRQVQELTGGFINNAYLSQIENGKVIRPGLEYLVEFSRLYGLSFVDLLSRCGYPVPEGLRGTADGAGMPQHLFDGLHEDDRNALIQYAAFLRKQRGNSDPA